MSDVNAQSAADRFTMICRHCDRPVIAREAWIGRDVQCPHCTGKLRVPPRPADGRPARAGAAAIAASRLFNFACGRCQSLLEANTGMSGQSGRCPTCGADFVIPFVDPRTGQPDGAAAVAADGEFPTPLHAYAASGDQAPRIVESPDGISRIECARCGTQNPIDANVCTACSVPFTIEAAPKAPSGEMNGQSIAAVILGLIGLAAWGEAIFGVAGALAIALGFASFRTSGGVSRPLLAIAGMVLGVISLVLAILGRF